MLRPRPCGWRFVVILIVGFVPSAVLAATDIYAARVPMASTAELDDAFSAALTRVLVKVTGRRDAAGYRDLMADLPAPATLVQQYRVDDEGLAWVRFDPVALKRILDARQMPVWGDDRPETLVWLAVDTGGGRREILPAEPDTAERRGFGAVTSDRVSRAARLVRDALLAAAEERGLPLVLPLVDSEDLQRVSVSDVWGGFEDSIERASSRYGAPAVLVGRATARGSGAANVRWALIRGGERMSWTGTVASGPERLADTFATRLATSSAGAQTLVLQVDGVASMADYGRVSKYLGSLSLVDQMSVTTVLDDTVVLALDVRGDPDRLMRTLALRNVLRPLAPGPVASGRATTLPVDLRYRLMP